MKEVVKSGKIIEEDKPGKIKEEVESRKIIEEDTSGKVIEEDSSGKIIEELLKKEEEKEEYDLFYPYFEYKLLSEQCQKMVQEAEKDPIKQFEVAKSLLEGKNEFPVNISLGMKYLSKFANSSYLESTIYFIQSLIKGNIIPRDLE